jgi:predicted RNase H-like nuclease
MKIALFRPLRARACDELVSRIARLRTGEPPLRLDSNPVTKALMDEPSPLDDKPYKHREDLLDAIVCAWTGAYWARWAMEKCQVLGATDPLREGHRATIIAPSRAEQRPH